MVPPVNASEKSDWANWECHLLCTVTQAEQTICHAVCSVDQFTRHPNSGWANWEWLIKSFYQHSPKLRNPLPSSFLEGIINGIPHASILSSMKHQWYSIILEILYIHQGCFVLFKFDALLYTESILVIKTRGPQVASGAAGGDRSHSLRSKQVASAAGAGEGNGAIARKS